DDHRTGNRGTREHILGREDIGAIAAGDGPRMGAADAVLAPTRTRGEHDMGGAELLHIGGGQAAVAIDADVRHALDPPGEMVAHPDPLVETGSLRLMDPAAAEFLSGLREMHGIAALAEGAGAFETGRTGTDDQHGVVGSLPRDDLRVPAAAPFLAH